jgi:hypothetical protein
MPELRKGEATARCVCGRVEIEATGAPITSIVCYCNDCQEAGRQIEAMPNAPAVRDPDGGTGYVAYRKDRVSFLKGTALLKKHKLDGKSPTNRVVATCCNSPMVLNFDDGKWWVDIYRARYIGSAPAVQMRVCTKFKPDNAPLPDDVPSHPRYPLKFLGKLVGARIAMLVSR